MLIEVDAKTFGEYFPTNPNPFISKAFIELNREKADKVVWLVGDKGKPRIGLVAGVINGLIKSPFSAPFGGFHFRKSVMHISEIDDFVRSLLEYIKLQGLSGIEITIPPDIYHLTFNAKTVSSLLRNGFQSKLPEITGWVNLDQFQGTFSQQNSREYYRQAIRNGLKFEIVHDQQEKERVYDLICENRAKFGRPIYMSFRDIVDTSSLWPIDFFKVCNENDEVLASAIFYRAHPQICYALFWADNAIGRPLRAMDFLAFHLWSYYKDCGFKFIDLGISTEAGTPNEGLLRFKESHDSTSSLRYSLLWKNSHIQ